MKDMFPWPILTIWRKCPSTYLNISRFVSLDCLIGKTSNWTLWSWNFFGLITGVGNGAIMSLCRLLLIRYAWSTSYCVNATWLLYKALFSLCFIQTMLQLNECITKNCFSFYTLVLATISGKRAT